MLSLVKVSIAVYLHGGGGGSFVQRFQLIQFRARLRTDDSYFFLFLSFFMGDVWTQAIRHFKNDGGNWAAHLPLPQANILP